ncbi:hypothetical protein GGI21_004259, partial [Coemansia aciculifera]
MRDWENKGDVWSKVPTMVMEVSEIDPDEYDKEDPDIVAWIRETARRVTKHAMVDYHRDFNWYLAYQRMRMADIPRGLAPSDVGDLVAFIERRNCIDIGSIDEAVQQLLELDTSAQRIIEALQLRLRRLCLEPALLMTSLQATTVTQAVAPRPAVVVVEPASPEFDDQLRSSCGRKSRVNMSGLGTTSTSHANFSSIAQHGGGGGGGGGLTVDADMSLALSRTSTRDQRAIGATDDDAAVLTNASQACPSVAIDAQGRVLYDQSSSDIGEVLQLLSPLNSQMSQKMLLDPSFQKSFGRFVQLSIVECPWLCRKHDRLTGVVAYNWAADGSMTTQGDEDEAAVVVDDDDNVSGTNQRQRSRDGASVPVHLAGRHARKLLEGKVAPGVGAGGRVGGASVASLATAEGSSASSYKAHHMSMPVGGGGGSSTEPAQSSSHLFQSHGSSETPAVADIFSSPAPVTDLFSHARVESLPGSLLVVDPEDSEYVARLIVLNPFSYHGVLELLFARSAADGEVKLDKVRAVARLRQRDGLHEYERKHINLAMSTISAVVWD